MSLSTRLASIAAAISLLGPVTTSGATNRTWINGGRAEMRFEFFSDPNGEA